MSENNQLRKLTDWEIEFIQENILHEDKEKGKLLEFFAKEGAIRLNEEVR